MTPGRGTVPFCFVDVFARRPLTGNPLSLVPDADDLTEPQLRAIAREFNQSETTFVLKPSVPGFGAAAVGSAAVPVDELDELDED